jgi:hypothetical protein
MSLFLQPSLRTRGCSLHWWPGRHLLRFCALRSVGVASKASRPAGQSRPPLTDTNGQWSIATSRFFQQNLPTADIVSEASAIS